MSVRQQHGKCRSQNRHRQQQQKAGNQNTSAEEWQLLPGHSLHGYNSGDEVDGPEKTAEAGHVETKNQVVQSPVVVEGGGAKGGVEGSAGPGSQLFQQTQVHEPQTGR